MREIIGAVGAVAAWYLFLMSFNSFATWTFYQDMDIREWSRFGRACFLITSLVWASMGAMAANGSRGTEE